MRIFSFVRKGLELVPIEVEVRLMAGCNQLQIMGLPDAAIKESALRIKSALKSQGYIWPAGKQILVNLRPSHWRKSSRGLELAIACGYLWASGQLEAPQGEAVYVYGELALDGRVYAPDDLDSLFDHPEQIPILTGSSSRGFSHQLLTVSNLSELNQPTLQAPTTERSGLDERPPTFERKDLCDLRFSPLVARLMTLVAGGEHATLLAGPAGSGKSTFAQALHAILPPAAPALAREIRRVRRWFGDRDTEDRPLVMPHHTVPPMAMIGGGSPVFPGEITHAHGGLLLLDEFLEFHAQVKEALREPLESGEIIVARRGQSQLLPAKFLLLATTNLCHCGRLVPNKKLNCTYSLTRCRSYLERLSGPLLDRFDILAFSDQWSATPKPSLELLPEDSGVPLQKIAEQVHAMRIFQMERTGGEAAEVNGRLDGTNLRSTLDPFVRDHLLPSTPQSQRRQRALMRVARTIADLDASASISARHLDEAAQWTWRSFEDLQTIFS